jgi:ABC-2 type transport system ATP-binding protein
MLSNETLIRVEHLHRHYGALHAVNDVSFELAAGEVLGFLGPNGAGKSTTMQILTGNLAPSAGRVLVAGQDLLDEPRRAKREIGYLPEQPPLYRELTVDEYLGFCARLRRVPRARLASALDAAKQRCGLGEVGRRLIGNLSKGFQQRVGIAQAIIHSPRVVILDEPTVGLDPIQIREIRTLIRELGQGHSVILSTHILPEVQAVCDRVQIIHQGRLVYASGLADLTSGLHDASLIAAFVQIPTPATLKALPGVSAVEALGDGRYRIRHTPGASPAPHIAELAVNHGWGLLELVPERVDLEQLFVHLTCGDEAIGEAA